VGPFRQPGPRTRLKSCLRSLLGGPVVRLGTAQLFAIGVFVALLGRIAVLAILVVLLLLRWSTLSIASVSGVIWLISVDLRSSAAILAALRIPS
jgi:hypothetical protein